MLEIKSLLRVRHAELLILLLKYSHLSINSGSTEKKAWENEGIRDETFILLLHSCCVHALGRLYPKL